MNRMCLERTCSTVLPISAMVNGRCRRFLGALPAAIAGAFLGKWAVVALLTG
jgi:hypothetical protein